MAWKIDTGSTSSGIHMNIHANSGVLTYSSGCSTSNRDNCGNCGLPNGGTVVALLEPDITNTKFDNYSDVRSTITYTTDVQTCDQEWLIMDFSSNSNSYKVLDHCNGFDAKMVDECKYIVYGAPMIRTQDFKTSGVHEIKYRTISDTIKSNTLTGTTELTYIYFPHKYNNTDFGGVNTKKIEANAFSDNINLSGITLSAVEEIGDKAFFNCYGLTSIDWGDSKCPNTDCCSGCSQETKIGDSAFENCRSLETLGDFGSLNTLTTLGTRAFKNCTSLKEVTLPTGLTAISAETFMNCYQLSSATISDGMIMIGNSAFTNCYALKEINIPNTVTSLGINSFSNCSSASALTLSNKLTVIPPGCFYNCTRITSITIPDSVETIGQAAFGLCGSSNVVENFTITIGSGVKTIGDDAFAQCRTLKSINIPNNVETIGDGAFYGCNWLTSVTIWNGVTSISGNAFATCINLSQVTIGSGIASIGAQAFYGCDMLTTVTINAVDPPTLGSSVFLMCDNIEAIYVPSGSVDRYKAASGWREYASKIQEIP